MTVRTLPDLLRRFSNSRHGNEAQDLRDLLASVMPPQFSGVSLSKSTAQTVATSAPVTWDGTHWDTDSYADLASNRALIPPGFGGLFLVTAHLQYLQVNAGTDTGIQVNISTAQSAPSAIRWGRRGESNTIPAFEGSVAVLLDAGDTVGLTAFGDASFDVRGSDNGAYLQVMRLGQAPPT